MRGAAARTRTTRRTSPTSPAGRRASGGSGAASLSPPSYGVRLADQTARGAAPAASAPESGARSDNAAQLASAPVPAAEIPAPRPEAPVPARDETAEMPAPEAIPSEPGAETVELIMPEPPEGLSETDEQQLQAAGASAGAEARSQEDLPSPGENVSEARQAVQEPVEETAARANAGLAEALGEQPRPSPEIEALCQNILRAIRERRPPDEDSLLQTNPREEAEEAGAALQSSVESDAESVETHYDRVNESPQGTPQQQSQPMDTPPESVAGRDLGASEAVPEAVPDENVSLEADVEASAARMQEAGMTSEPAELVQSGPIAEARAAQGELSEASQRDPAEVLAEQQAARDSARSDMIDLQRRALEALQNSRSQTVGGIGSRQEGMVESEEQMRTRISNQAQRIFDTAQSQVSDLIEPLTRNAIQRWETGVEELSTLFETDLARIQRWKDERHSGIGGAVVAVWDAVTGLPDWMIAAYDRAERNFGQGVCRLLREISTEVNGIIATCERLIENANREIAALFENLPASLEEWAAGEQVRFSEQLDRLHDNVLSARDDFNHDLSERASRSVQEVRERIHELRQEARGLLGSVIDAVAAFAEDPARFILEGLLELVGIPPASFWALVNRIQSVISDIADNPMGFANNLAAALGQGFQKFFDNFATHILGGFFDWLFSGLGAVGVEIPRDFSLQSLITFFLQLMGITWARIRQILARHIGEENVALLEQAYELIATLIEQGPQGIFEMIREQLNPRTILNAVLEAAVDFLIEALIRAVTPRIIAMFNPAGAIIQAIEVIYRILAWIFNNAARIFSLIETVVNGAAELIAGNFTGMATAVESALARLIAPVIDFLAGFLGLGNLPDRIADTIRGFQEMVLGVIDRVVAWLAQRARSLLQALGIGSSGEDPAPEQESTEQEDENAITQTFDMEGQGHTLQIDLETRQVTLESTKSPLDAKLNAGKRQLEEYGDSAKAGEAENAINRMISLFEQIVRELQEYQSSEGNPERKNTSRAKLRDFSRQTKLALDNYGGEFNVTKITDGLPDYGPVVVGPHPADPGRIQPDGSSRESHHVPPKELSQSIRRSMEETAQSLEGNQDEAAQAAASSLNARARAIRENPNGNRLTAISLHRVTHQNAGGVAVHAAAMREDIVEAIRQIDRGAEQETIQIVNSQGLAVNPRGKTIDEFLELVNQSLAEEEDREQARRINAEVNRIKERTEEAGEGTAIERSNRLIERAFSSSLTQGFGAVQAALRHSILDGPEDVRNQEVGKLRSEAREDWTREGVLSG